MSNKTSTEEISDAIFTMPNVISFIRLCMVPVFLFLLFDGYDIAATAVYAIAAITDFLDGQIARRTHTVSKLGKLLDPAVDTLLMIVGVIGLVLVGRLPAWIAVLVFARELLLLAGGGFLLKKYDIHIPVIYPGKFATTFLFVGFVGLMLDFPVMQGIGVCDISWLPGFDSEQTSWGIWLVYAGLVLQIAVTIYYCIEGAKAYLKAKDDEVRI